MSVFPLEVDALIEWLRSTATKLDESRIVLAEIRERREYLPAAFAEFQTDSMTGGISGWVNGLFDFEIYRGVDGKQIFFRHEEVSTLDSPALAAALADFIDALSNSPSEQKGGGSVMG